MESSSAQPSPALAPRRGYHHGRLKEALLEAARDLIAERGPAGFTLSEAAKRVGVTAAAPYRHFSDRNDLIGELARRGFEVFGQRLETAFGGGAPDAVTAMQRMGAEYLAFSREEPGLYGAMFASAAALAANGPCDTADRAFAILSTGCAAVLRQFGAPDAGAPGLAFQLWSLSHGVAMLAMGGHLPEPWETLNEGSHGLFERAVRLALAPKG